MTQFTPQEIYTKGRSPVKFPTEEQIQRMREALDYCPETGLFTWKEKPVKGHRKPGAIASFNKKLSGKEAGSQHKGYVRIRFENTGWMAHRLAWAMSCGKLESGEIDHINGDRSDNRLVNLRLVSASENCRNRGVCAKNTSGRVGVYFRSDLKAWFAVVGVNGKTIKSKTFKTFDEALEARKEFESKYGFHENHGSRQAFCSTYERKFAGDA